MGGSGGGSRGQLGRCAYIRAEASLVLIGIRDHRGVCGGRAME